MSIAPSGQGMDAISPWSAGEAIGISACAGMDAISACAGMAAAADMGTLVVPWKIRITAAINRYARSFLVILGQLSE